MNQGAIAGLKVVDLTRVLGGPYCTQMLADHGADVIKVEPPQGDETRDYGGHVHVDSAPYFMGANRNKRSIGLDLSKPGAREVLFKLLEGADVLIENFKTGTMERWGLGYEEVLKARFPRLIHCRISGFGADGPLGGFPGYDAIVQAMAGMFSINGTAESGPTRIGIPMVDMGTGLYSCVAILMAIIEREKSGLGQYLDMTLYDCAISLMHPHLSNWLMAGKVPSLSGNAHVNIAPYDKFMTQTGEIFLGTGNDRTYRKFCEVIGKPEMGQDPRFRRNADRLNHMDELRREIETVLAEQDGEEICKRLLDAGVAAGPVLNTDQVMEAEHTAHRSMKVQIDWYKGAGTPIKLSRTPGSMHRPPPAFAEHSREILAEHGFSEQEITALADERVLVETRS